jgi:hypothetical protein
MLWYARLRSASRGTGLLDSIWPRYGWPGRRRQLWGCSKSWAAIRQPAVEHLLGIAIRLSILALVLVLLLLLRLLLLPHLLSRLGLLMSLLLNLLSLLLSLLGLLLKLLLCLLLCLLLLSMELLLCLLLSTTLLLLATLLLLRLLLLLLLSSLLSLLLLHLQLLHPAALNLGREHLAKFYQFLLRVVVFGRSCRVRIVKGPELGKTLFVLVLLVFSEEVESTHLLGFIDDHWRGPLLRLRLCSPDLCLDRGIPLRLLAVARTSARLIHDGKLAKTWLKLQGIPLVSEICWLEVTMNRR